MYVVAHPYVLAAFRHAYDLAEPKPPPREVARIIADAAETGFTGLIEADSVLLGMDGRAAQIGPRELLTVLGIVPQWLYRRPRHGERQSFGIERIAATDLAYVLILMERFGFAIDPEPLCVRLRPALTRKALLTAAELAIYWHASERHRMEPITIATGPSLTHGKPADTLRTGTGYRMDCWRDETGNPAAITVRPPRRRRERDPLAHPLAA